MKKVIYRALALALACSPLVGMAQSADSFFTNLFNPSANLSEDVCPITNADYCTCYADKVLIINCTHYTHNSHVCTLARIRNQINSLGIEKVCSTYDKGDANCVANLTHYKSACM